MFPEEPGYKNENKEGRKMDFLKDILGDELYKQMAEKVNAYNGDEANKDKQVKLANLATGGYVSKDKYAALETSLNGKQTELDTANGLIAELKKSTKGNEELQTKITGYETQVADLQKQLQEIKLKSAIKVALLSEKANDIDYLTYKLENKLKDEKKTLELDDNGNIKGWKEVVDGLKIQYPNQFTATQEKQIEPNKLPAGDNKQTEPVSLADALKARYEQK